MRPTRTLIALLLVFALAACATEPPRYRKAALGALVRVYSAGAETLFPGEFRSTMETYGKAEALQKEGERDQSEEFYYLTMLKGELLEKEIVQLKARQREEELKRQEERKRAELARQAQEEANRLARLQAEAQAQAQREAIEAARRKVVKPPKERIVLVSSYTVRRGESLPFIASQPEVYGDRLLWPLIYKANRAQIRDPRHIWPGQVLRIPRNQGRDDIAEAKRYAQDHPLH
ncbi:LysM peptidoglycan-binding domain-containing protein [Geomonas sp.]|uniref:LysM peptidoglycan-binding domain-containing protein n=1 Tax=Geomonas sp. TaxID=2651584 RepID=UPI002B46B5FF|nr:LysM peptidoglycan-binding domain-containing protein [Geomonas sp.]HJV35944.1 LysM peptidoglycan-binding domain-containing protein [Geomonas sp.]